MVRGAAWLAWLAVTGAGVAGQETDATEAGVTFRVYHVGYPIDRLYPLAPGQTPNIDERRDTIDFRSSADFGRFEDYFVVEVLADLVVDQEGVYGFRLTSDDGARLTLDDRLVIQHDGLHAATSRTAEQTLTPGPHALRLVMFENTGESALRLEWRPPGAANFSIIPSERLRVERGVTRVVAPGPKRLLDYREPVGPGDGMPLDRVHPGWVIEDLRPQGFEPQVGGMAFLPDGRLLITTFEPLNNGILREAPNGSVWALEGVIGGTPATITPVLIADGFHDPCGLAVVDGDIYVAHRTDITRLRDADQDGVFEEREVFASGWESDNYHHFTFGLVHHDGWLYGTLSTSIYFENTVQMENVRGPLVSMNGPNPPNRGTCFRVSLEDGHVEYVAGGLRTPNGIAVGPEGAIFVTDNQGAWLPSSKLIHIQPGRFYGYRADTATTSDRYPQGGAPSLFSDQPVSPPAVWLPQNEVSNSPTQPLLIREGPYAGQMFLAELTMGGIRRVFLERVRGEFQGAVFRHSQGFESGLNRLIEGPDGMLYVGGTGADGNWNWDNTRSGLQRIRRTAQTTFEYHSVRATPDGFEIFLTRPVERAWLEDAANYRIIQWRYHATPEYGGAKQEEAHMVVTRAVASGDRRSVRVTVPGLREGSVVRIRMDPVSDGGAEMWATEAWYTLNRIPLKADPAPEEIRPLERPDLRAFQAPHGAWVVAGNAAVSPANSQRLAWEPTGHGVIINGATGDTSDLLTSFDHGDVEAHIEFMVPQGAESGAYFMGRYEIQIRDSWGTRRPGIDDCGGIPAEAAPAADGPRFDGSPPRANASRPPGEWQSYDVLFRAPRFDELGQKIENARFVRVVHNGIVIHEDVEVTGPTRGSLFTDERPFGPLRLVGGGGPVAFRNIRLRPLPAR